MPTAYISEVSYAGSPPTDFLEVAVTTGTDVSAWTIKVYNQTGNWLFDMPFPAPTTTLAGKDVYEFNTTLTEFTSIAIVDGTGTALQFVSFYDPPVTSVDGDLAGQTPTYAGVTATSGQSVQSDDGGSSYYVQSSPNPGTIPCFAPGMLVDCPDTPRQVETLAPGDLVKTLDRGDQPVLWVSRREAVFERADYSDRPILVPAGAFGARADLIVSPQHRLLLDARQEILVPAKALIGFSGIRPMRGRRRMTWHHFALARHDLVRVNGLWTESLLLGPMVVRGLTRDQKRGLYGLYPGARDGPLNGPPARPCLSVQQAKALLSAKPFGRPGHVAARA